MKLYLSCFSFLALTTLFCHKWIDQYTAIGPGLLSNQWQIRAQDGCQGIAQDGKLFFTSQDALKSINIYQDVAGFKSGMLLFFSADIRSNNVTPGPKPWNRARLLLVQNDGKKDRWDFHHVLSSIEGSFDWKRFANVFTVNPLTKKLKVIAQMSRCSGRFEVKNISLVPVTVRPVYVWTARVVLSLWALFGLLLMGPVWIRGRHSKGLSVVLGMAFAGIIIGTTMPVGLKNKLIKGINAGAEAVKEIVMPMNTRGIPWKPDKVGHFCFFALFCFMLARILNREPVFCIMAYLLMVAAGTEFAQVFIDGRSYSFGDFFIDAAGGILGILISLKSHFFCGRPKTVIGKIFRFSPRYYFNKRITERKK